MRSLLMILLLANLVVFASQFDVVRGMVGDSRPPLRPAQLNAELLRIVRAQGPSASAVPGAATAVPPEGQPPSGTNSR